MNDHDTADIAFPARSRARTRTEYVLPRASATSGENVAVRRAGSYPTVPATGEPAPVVTAIRTDPAATPSENTTAGDTDGDTLRSPSTGDRDTTAGGVVSGARPGRKTGVTQ